MFRRPAIRWRLPAALLLGAGALFAADPQFIEISEKRRLSFQCNYGETFEGLDGMSAMMQRNIGNGAAVGDYDNDGDLDILLLAQRGDYNTFFRNDHDLGIKWFTEVTLDAGLGNLGQSRAAQFVDLDNDGFLDLVLLNDDDGSGDHPPSGIFRNNGDGTFDDLTEGSGFRPLGYIRSGLSIADFDDDGLLDIYVSNWGREVGSGSPQFPYENLLYRNLGDFVFEDVTVVSRLGGLARDSFTAIFHDFNGNSRPDLFVTVDHTSDEFYRNVNGQIFTRVTEAVGATHIGNDMGVDCIDVDGDLDLDLYATNITDPDFFFGSTQYNALHINQLSETGQLSFVDEALLRGVEDTYWGWGTVFTDVDLDGDPDIVAVTGFEEFIATQGIPGSPLLGTPTVLFLNDGSGYFTRDTTAGLDDPDDSRALVALDYDRDGDEDLLVTNIEQPVRLYENVTQDGGHWLGFTLIQRPGGNRNAIGASIYVSTGGITRRHEVIVSDSFLTGSPAEVLAGLGPATHADEVRVVWTDGGESTFQDIPADQWVRLSQATPDGDLDGLTDADDCAASDGEIWSLPGPVRDLVATGGEQTRLSWSKPGDAGALYPVYDVLRGSDPAKLDTACLASGLAAREFTDAEIPQELFFYLVRIDNGCGNHAGFASGGAPRLAPACP